MSILVLSPPKTLTSKPDYFSPVKQAARVPTADRASDKRIVNHAEVDLIPSQRPILTSA